MSVKKIPIVTSLFFTTIVGIVNMYNNTDFQILTIIMLISLAIFYFIGILLKKVIIELLKVIKKYIIEQINVNNKDNKTSNTNTSKNANKKSASVINYAADDDIDLKEVLNEHTNTNNTKSQDLDSELNSIVNVVKEKI